MHAYEEALRGGPALWTRPVGGGAATRLDVTRFLGLADEADAQVLDHCVGPILDIGCGPARIVAACAAAGHEALGIDTAREAIRTARARGAHVIRADVFGTVPDPGRWGTALLLDGNIGIGADPVRLLRRISALLAPSGRVIVETDTEAQTERCDDLVFVDERGQRRSSAFSWARLGREHLERVSREAGFDPALEWTAGGRQFTALTLRAA